MHLLTSLLQRQKVIKMDDHTIRKYNSGRNRTYQRPKKISTNRKMIRRPVLTLKPRRGDVVVLLKRNKTKCPERHCFRSGHNLNICV